MPSVLLEVCFVDSQADCDIYHDQFEEICEALASELAGKKPDEAIAKFEAEGTVSHFGEPDDTGVSPSEDLAFIYTTSDKPVLFLSYQPEGYYRIGKATKSRCALCCVSVAVRQRDKTAMA